MVVHVDEHRRILKGGQSALAQAVFRRGVQGHGHVQLQRHGLGNLHEVRPRKESQIGGHAIFRQDRDSLAHKLQLRPRPTMLPMASPSGRT